MLNIEKTRKQIAVLKNFQRRGFSLAPAVEKAMKQAESALIEHDYGSGATQTATVQGTGARRVLFKPGSQADKSSGWLVSCEKHGEVLGTRTKKVGVSRLTDPAWCTGCSSKT